MANCRYLKKSKTSLNTKFRVFFPTIISLRNFGGDEYGFFVKTEMAVRGETSRRCTRNVIEWTDCLKTKEKKTKKFPDNETKTENKTFSLPRVSGS